MKCLSILFVSLTILGVMLATVRAADEPKTDKAAVVKGNTEFALELYQQLRSQDGNLFLSPYSISSALAMTSAGAAGKTADEMVSTLHLLPDAARRHAAFGEIVKELNAAGEKRPYQLTVANALWGQKGTPFRPEFLKLVKDNYGAGLEEVDFIAATEKARQTINGWVEEKTKDKIKELLKPGVLTTDTRLVLTNAIYFKSAWQYPFPQEAKPGEFTVSATKKLDKVPLMKHKRDFRYFETDTIQALDLPYERNDLSMLVFLPKKVDGLAEMEKGLTAEQLAAWKTKWQIHEVDMTLPKFKVTAEFQLNKVLTDMGMKTAFTPAADFSGMTSGEKLMISAVVHKAFVDVHEKGTEAAAATGVVVGVTSVPPPRPKAVFKADHPFTFLIVENRTGSVLFMGRLVDPS